MIPQASPPRRIARFRGEIDEAIASVLGGSDYILGSAVASFESAFAQYCGGSHCVGVASGTDALFLTLRGLGIGPGDEVIVPALTFVGSAQAILQCGAQPVFVDVDPATRCIDPAATSDAVSGRTAAIMPVHLFGYPADMPAIMEIADRHGLAVVEDCAQSHGATLQGRPLGTFGLAAAYSFYPTKNLGCIGDGGAVVTQDAALADRIKSLRNYGFAPGGRVSHTLGFNARLDELQAAILLALLPHLDAGNAERRAAATGYRTKFEPYTALGLPLDHEGCVYHQYALTYADRDGLVAHLAAAGIGSAIHYTPGLHRHPAFVEYKVSPLPVTDSLSKTLLSLPVQPEVALGAEDRIADAVLAFIE